MATSKYCDYLFPRLQAENLPLPESEHQFAKEIGRKWRFDFAWINRKIALEVEGGVWTGGRHNRGSGFLKDMEKYNTALLLGWRVLRCTPTEIKNGKVVELWLKKVLGSNIDTTENRN